MKGTIFACILVCILVMIPLACAQAADKTVVNLMIDADIPASATEEQLQEASTLLHAIYTQLDERDLGATFFAAQDVIQAYGRLRLTYIGENPNFELAMSGESSDENLSAESFSEQKAILKLSKKAIESCKVCGLNEIIATGFVLHSFDQNEDTYKVLDELGIEYDAGFQAGVIYASGHQDDVWPYKLEGHNFYAVPVSTYNLSGQIVPLQDVYFNESGYSFVQWYDALVTKFNEAQGKDEPMVIIITKSLSGKGDYFETFKKFLDFATSKGAIFVTTMDLVNISREEAYMPPIKSAGDLNEDESVGVSITPIGVATNATSTSGGCATCDKKTQINASISN
jgi:hypothetical protein